MKYALLDDQLSFHETFRAIAKNYIQLEDCAFYTHFEDLMQDLSNGKLSLDVLFLDIQLQNVSGIALARQIYELYQSSILIVFLTNHDQLVYDAFGLNVIKFIYKPQFSKLAGSCFSALNKQFEDIKPLLIKSGERTIAIKKREIQMVSMELRKAVFYTADHQAIISNYRSIHEVFNLLDSKDFNFINRSQIVNIQYLEGMSQSSIYLRGVKQPLTVSKTYRPIIKQLWREKYVRLSD